MYLICIKIFFACFMYDLSKGSEQGEFVKQKPNLDAHENYKNESTKTLGSPLVELLQEKPFAIAIELREPLLEQIKEILDENEINFPTSGSTILATFDSQGLQDVLVCNDTYEVRQTIMRLRPTFHQRGGFSPTIQTLGELLQEDIPEEIVLLVTMSKPSDENLGSNLMRSLIERKIQLSVLWAGKYPTDEYLLLKDIANKTGGKFRHIIKTDNSETPTNRMLESDVENLFEQIKFPEEQKSTTGVEAPLVSRAENQRLLQKTVIPLIIEVASGTKLEIQPGTLTQIQFNVKNNMNMPLPVIFNAKLNNVVQNVQPRQAILQPSETVTVIINLQPLGTPHNLNAIATVTLTAIVANKPISRSAIISFTPQLTFAFLKSAGLRSETEEFLMAAHDGVCGRLVHRWAILKEEIASKNCRACGTRPETVMHLLSACPSYAKSLYIKRPNAVLRPISDTTAPKIYHKYVGDCSNYREPQNCENGHWSIEATIQDEESGLLKILSEPYGLIFQSEFVAGTKSPVTVDYSATCCQPTTIIWAEDLKGNYVKKTFDVFNQNLLAGEIASIVLGVLFILFIIIAVIVAVIFIRRRNQRNMIIPRSSSR